MQRRDFLRLPTISAGALLAGCAQAGESDEVYELGEEFFPSSIASGDPRSDSVILWTRLVDDSAQGEFDLSVQMSMDEGFGEFVEEVLEVRAEDDGCVKVRMTELGSASFYHYRFVYRRDGINYTSRTGRTRTAPEAGADVPVRFAFVTCQDFIGRYYNLYRLLNEEEPEFIVHLGDYIYDTTGDPLFQSEAGDRSI